MDSKKTWHALNINLIILNLHRKFSIIVKLKFKTPLKVIKIKL